MRNLGFMLKMNLIFSKICQSPINQGFCFFSEESDKRGWVSFHKLTPAMRLGAFLQTSGIFQMHLISSSACIFSGFLTIMLTYYKPSAYWNNASRKFFRNIIGDNNTAILHHAIGVLLIVVGTILIARELEL